MSHPQKLPFAPMCELLRPEPFLLTTTSAGVRVMGRAITEADSGHSVCIVEGQKIILHLDSAASTAYHWEILSVDPWLLYPDDECEFVGQVDMCARDHKISQFIWSAKHAEIGQHHLSLGYFPPGHGRVATREIGFRIEVLPWRHLELIASSRPPVIP